MRASDGRRVSAFLYLGGTGRTFFVFRADGEAVGGRGGRGMGGSGALRLSGS